MASLTVDPGTTTSVAFSPDGTLLLAGGWGPSSLWRLGNRGEIGRVSLEQPVAAMTLSPDGGLVAAADDEGSVHFRETMTGREIASLSGLSSRPIALAFSPDGGRFAAFTEDCVIEVWDLTKDHRIGILRHECAKSGDPTGMAFSPDGSVLASFTRDGRNEIRLWNLSQGTRRDFVEAHPYAINSVAFSPDGRHLASGDKEGFVRIREIDMPGAFEELDGARYMLVVASSPDGKHLATAGFDGGLLWDVDSRQVVQRFGGQPDSDSFLTFSPDGSLFAMTEGHGLDSIRVFETETGIEKTRFSGHRDKVVSVAFVQNGDTLVSASLDGTVRRWSLADPAPDSGEEFLELARYRTGLSMEEFEFLPRVYEHLVPLVPGVFEDQEVLECQLRPRWMERFEENRHCYRKPAP